MAADNDGAVVVTGACPPISRRSDRAGQSIYSVGFCRLPGWSCLVQRSTMHSVSSKGRRSRDLIRVVLSCLRDKTPHTNSLLVKHRRPHHTFLHIFRFTYFENIFVCQGMSSWLLIQDINPAGIWPPGQYLKYLDDSNQCNSTSTISNDISNIHQMLTMTMKPHDAKWWR